tara:strand:- start:1008 stop:1394 length:387 start_codon:yes stop_codon:yes gene_type:complete
MASVGGSIQSCSLAGRTFAVASDSDSNRDLGGFSNEIIPNGDGATARIIKTIKSWKLDGLSLVVDDSRGDMEFLQDLANQNDFNVISIQYASGAIYSGQGTITGDLMVSSQSATAAVVLEGPGNLTKQ